MRVFIVGNKRLTTAEDRLIERWAKACGEKHDCGRCPDEAICQRLADKLVSSVPLITMARRTSSVQPALRTQNGGKL